MRRTSSVSLVVSQSGDKSTASSLVFQSYVWPPSLVCLVLPVSYPVLKLVSGLLHRDGTPGLEFGLPMLLQVFHYPCCAVAFLISQSPFRPPVSLLVSQFSIGSFGPILPTSSWRRRDPLVSIHQATAIRPWSHPNSSHLPINIDGLPIW